MSETLQLILKRYWVQDQLDCDIKITFLLGYIVINIGKHIQRGRDSISVRLCLMLIL